MAGSTFGTIFKITTWGESHGKALGVVIDGCPAGLSLCEEDIHSYLDRRKPGATSISTPRKEADQVEFSPASLRDAPPELLSCLWCAIPPRFQGITVK